MEKISPIERQVRFWKKYGFAAPLLFVAVGVVVELLNIFHFHIYIIIGGGIAAATAVVWWWWTIFTISKLNRILTKNTENFSELVGIVKEMNKDIHETRTSNRKRGKQETPKSQ